MESIHITNITSASPEYQAVWELREEVLRKPLGMSLKNEDLSMDAEDIIFIAQFDGKVIACLMLHHIGGTIYKLRQMAVANDWQGKQIGRQLVVAAEKFAVEKGFDTIVLHARQIVCGFYESLGYDITSSAFTEVGIPHVIMKKKL